MKYLVLIVALMSQGCASNRVIVEGRPVYDTDLALNPKTEFCTLFKDGMLCTRYVK